MSKASTIGLDLAKQVFQAHGADASGQVVFRTRLRRAKVMEFFAGLSPCLVAMEACSNAHYWAREIGRLGHTVRLLAPAYVKPFVKRQKNDAADAEAICEAAQRPTMRFVAVKREAAQSQCRRVSGAGSPGVPTHARINALRGHLGRNMGWSWPRDRPMPQSSSSTLKIRPSICQMRPGWFCTSSSRR